MESWYKQSMENIIIFASKA